MHNDLLKFEFLKFYDNNSTYFSFCQKFHDINLIEIYRKHKHNMAPTIIRVKRKLDEAQDIEAKIVLNCKKQKLNEKVKYN
jgi:hypothetical protein